MPALSNCTGCLRKTWRHGPASSGRNWVVDLRNTSTPNTRLVGSERTVRTSPVSTGSAETASEIGYNPNIWIAASSVTLGAAPA